MKIQVCLLLLLTCPAGLLHAADGTLDPTFGNNGRVTINWMPGDAEPAAIAIGTNGNIFIAGDAAEFGSVPEFLLLKLHPAGQIDTAFAPLQGGFFRFDFALNGIGPGGGNTANALAVLSDDKIVLAGCTQIGVSSTHFAVLRVDSTGQLDPTFGSTGSVHFAAPFAIENCVEDLFVRPDGAIVLGGHTRVPSDAGGSLVYRFYAATAVLTSSGQLDPAFLGGGVSEIRYAANAWLSYGIALAADSDGGSFLAGLVDAAGGTDAAILHLQNDGMVDAGFGNLGRLTLGMPAAEAHAIRVLPSGRVVLAGVSSNPGQGLAVFLARLNSDGTLDTSFGQSGIARFPIADAGLVGLLAPTRNHGWLVEAADTGRAGIWLVRVDENGHPQAGFGTDGVLHVAFGPANGSGFGASKVALQPDGKLVVAGALSGNAADDFAVMRILADYDTLFVDDFELRQ